jgi:hypothetical protein
MTRRRWVDDMFGPPGAPHRRQWMVLAAVLTAAVIIVPVVWVLVTVPGPPAPSAYPTVPASLGGANGSPVALDQGFLGVNVRSDEPLSASTLTALNATGVRFARWPGGELGDRYDPLANGGTGAIYSDAGQATPAAASLAQFVAWCRSTGCRSVITLPAEIDNASLALAIVNFTEGPLGFRPTYWEIGNEPALWTHYGIPWAQWNTAQNVTVTPDEFAALVGSYVRAIRTVDTTTGIVGIGGIGKGASDVATWFDPVLAADGPNLSAMAIHVYPAGLGYPPQYLPGWFGSLHGATGMPGRVTNATTVMDSACPTCHLALLVDEFQTGNNLTAANSLAGGNLAAFVAAEIVQSLPLPITTLDYFDLQGETAGAWLDPAGAPSPAYQLFTAIDQHLGAYAAQLSVSASAPGLWAAEGGATPSSLTNLLLVNANPATGYRLNLSDRLPPAPGASAWVYNGSASSPSNYPLPDPTLLNWTIPPASVVLLSGLAGPGGAHDRGSGERAPSALATAGAVVVLPGTALPAAPRCTRPWPSGRAARTPRSGSSA